MSSGGRPMPSATPPMCSNPFAHLDPAHVPLSIPVSSFDYKHRPTTTPGTSLNTRWRMLHDTWTHTTQRSKQKREALERAEPPPPPPPPPSAASTPQLGVVAQNFFDTLSAQGDGFSQVIR